MAFCLNAPRSLAACSPSSAAALWPSEPCRSGHIGHSVSKRNATPADLTRHVDPDMAWQSLGKPSGWTPAGETDHFVLCLACGQAFDMRSLDEVLHHAQQGHLPLPLDG